MDTTRDTTICPVLIKDRGLRQLCDFNDGEETDSLWRPISLQWPQWAATSVDVEGGVAH